MKKKVAGLTVLLFVLLIGVIGIAMKKSPIKIENGGGVEELSTSAKGDVDESRSVSETTESPTAPAHPGTEVESDVQPLSFIHVEGESLVDEAGKVFRIKGMGFGNNVWANPSTPTLTHHNEESYAELEALGFNSVRFYINYKLFEDDSNPYVYKESAFEWLDQNIEWAREHNIRLILNMHVPQGGFISSSSVKFWDSSENLLRYIALWSEIAKRYADEPVILGYGLMNEPFVPKMNTTDASLNMYYYLIETLAAAIRVVDSNHILFIERPYGIVDSNNSVNYAWGDTGSFKTIADDNVVYEFHFYEYTQFTSQGISWATFEKDWYYGDDRIALLSGARNYSAICKGEALTEYDLAAGGWQYVESPIYDTDNYAQANAAYFLLYFSNLNTTSTVYIDDIVIKEYDADGQYIRDVYEYSFDTTTACSGWDLGTGGGGKCSYNKTEGHTAPGCEMLTGAGASYRFYKNSSLYNNFTIKEGNRYQVTYWVKLEGDQQITLEPGLQLISVENVYSMNKDFLESKLLTYINIGKEYGVPIYIGEFGTTSHIMGNEFGGENWVADVLDIFNKYSLNYSYHDYHEENYGLYTTPSTQERTTVNEALYSVFEAKVKE